MKKIILVSLALVACGGDSQATKANIEQAADKFCELHAQVKAYEATQTGEAGSP